MYIYDINVLMLSQAFCPFTLTIVMSNCHITLRVCKEELNFKLQNGDNHISAGVCVCVCPSVCNIMLSVQISTLCKEQKQAVLCKEQPRERGTFGTMDA